VNRTIAFDVAARDELREAIEYYEEQAPGLGVDFRAEVETLLVVTAEKPEIGSPFEAGTRRILLRRFPYSLIYLAEDERLIVVALMHQRRRPGYWRERISA
jgi:toxin ParE1/3/4